jgi:hypothetical protein
MALDVEESLLDPVECTDRPGVILAATYLNPDIFLTYIYGV